MADPRMSDSVKKRTRKPVFYRQSPLPPDGIQAIFCDSCITTWLTRWPGANSNIKRSSSAGHSG
jgi:hypothetical protein